MARISGNAPAAAGAGSGTTGTDFRNVNLDDFLKLLITELQNQDPLNPMDNSEMVQQIGHIRQIGATNQLSETLTNLSISQQLVTASNLIGREVSGLSDRGEVIGKVDRVTVEGDKDDRKVKVHIGERTMEVQNIRAIEAA